MSDESLEHIASHSDPSRRKFLVRVLALGGAVIAAPTVVSFALGGSPQRVAVGQDAGSNTTVTTPDAGSNTTVTTPVDPEVTTPPVPNEQTATEDQVLRRTG